MQVLLVTNKVLEEEKNEAQRQKVVNEEAEALTGEVTKLRAVNEEAAARAAFLLERNAAELAQLAAQGA
jgi:hypothetical protein